MRLLLGLLWLRLCSSNWSACCSSRMRTRSIQKLCAIWEAVWSLRQKAWPKPWPVCKGGCLQWLARAPRNLGFCDTNLGRVDIIAALFALHAPLSVHMVRAVIVMWATGWPATWMRMSLWSAKIRSGKQRKRRLCWPPGEMPQGYRQRNEKHRQPKEPLPSRLTWESCWTYTTCSNMRHCFAGTSWQRKSWRTGA